MIKESNITMTELTEETIISLKSRGVELLDIAEIVHFLQRNYIDDLSIETCKESVLKVLSKREVCHAILTGIAIDIAAEENKLDSSILSIIQKDDKLYGIDEIIPLSIVNLYGSIGLTNFGYLDRVKTGIIGELDSQTNQVNTFLDDLVAAIAASASARIAHSDRE